MPYPNPQCTFPPHVWVQRAVYIYKKNILFLAQIPLYTKNLHYTIIVSPIQQIQYVSVDRDNTEKEKYLINTEEFVSKFIDENRVN